VAAPRRRLSLLRLAALPEARAERQAGGGVENGFYVLSLRAEACLTPRDELERLNGLRARKKTRKAGEGLRSSVPSSDPCPSLPSRDASPVSVGKDGYQRNDEDDQKPGRHSDPFLGSRPDSTRNGCSLRVEGFSIEAYPERLRPSQERPPQKGRPAPSRQARAEASKPRGPGPCSKSPHRARPLGSLPASRTRQRPAVRNL
jgi:hypothetical protein